MTCHISRTSTGHPSADAKINWQSVLASTQWWTKIGVLGSLYVVSIYQSQIAFAILDVYWLVFATSHPINWILTWYLRFGIDVSWDLQDISSLLDDVTGAMTHFSALALHIFTAWKKSIVPQIPTWKIKKMHHEINRNSKFITEYIHSVQVYLMEIWSGCKKILASAL